MTKTRVRGEWIRVKTLSPAEKQEIAARCESFIETRLRPLLLTTHPPANGDQLVGLIGRWRGSKYSLIARYRVGSATNAGEEFDIAFARLDHVEEEVQEVRCNVMWHRHTGQWWPLHRSVSLDAEGRLRRAFEKLPSLDIYERLREIGGEVARDTAITALRGALSKERHAVFYDLGGLLVRIMTREAMFDEAWQTLHAHGASAAATEALAHASETTHPREVLQVYAQRVEQLAAQGGHAYHEAAQLIGRMALLRDLGEHEAYLSALKVRHGRKRNFMALLR